MAGRTGLSQALRSLAENRLPTIGMLNSFPSEFGFTLSGSKKSVPTQKLSQDNVDDRVQLLLNSGEGSRLALSKWRAVEERYFQSPKNTAFWIEEAALNLRNVVLLEDDDPLDFLDSADQTFEERLESAKQRIGDVANAVLATSRSLFLPDSKSGESKSPEENRSPEIQKQQLEAMAKVIFGDMELKLQPYEWVYDGLKPLFLDSVFDINKGIHISLSAVYCAVGRRLECPILPELASRSAVPGAPSGLSLAVAPAPDPWLIRIASARPFQGFVVDAPGTSPSKYFLDPTDGKILDAQECAKLYPALDQAGRDWPLPFWIGLLRTAMTAHQRRGDGDAVAHCMYQLLALDWHAPEWEAALQPAAIGRK